MFAKHLKIRKHIGESYSRSSLITSIRRCLPRMNTKYFSHCCCISNSWLVVARSCQCDECEP